MKFIVVRPLQINTPQGTISLELGKVLELSPEQSLRMGDNIQPVQVKTGKGLDHYCSQSNSWCSEKLPGKNHPAGCVQSSCEYHTGLLP